jgi:hypothetical protein
MEFQIAKIYGRVVSISITLIRNDMHNPKLYQGVTISSTFTDLKEHRAALIKSLKANGLTDICMENDAAKYMDVIDSSIEMVRNGSAYIGIIAKKYGQTPEDAEKNPENLSITELEYDEAFNLHIPILLFIMGDEHMLLAKDVEQDQERILKLKAFTQRAKIMKEGSSVHRVYAVFNSLEDFKVKAAHSVAALKRHLDEQKIPSSSPYRKKKKASREKALPMSVMSIPPAFHAEPPYIGSHPFIGRKGQLDELNDWAKPADPNNILLFEAIGGNGKSMLTWEWATKHAATLRTDWAGIFWYSFYEKGAIMASFCRYALAYITRQPVEVFNKIKTKELKNMLLGHLKSRPWLIVLDGLERVLVAYNRIDAAEVREEELENPEDKIVHRNPCNCTNIEDDELLRLLSTTSASKILITTRLVPQALLNKAGQPIPGVLRMPLKGLRPSDAEAMFRVCGITGNSEAIQAYLTANCDCHPLIIGVLAGLVTHYLPAKGNFDTWAADPNGGGKLNLASLDLVQKRNHILKVAMEGLSPKSHELLNTLALLGEAADYYMLTALNPHIPEEPVEVEEPLNPKNYWSWKRLTEDEKEKRMSEYKKELQRWKVYLEDLQKWKLSPAYLDAPNELQKTVRDLEVRGLLQYDANNSRYDLHPVVRGVASGSLKENEKEEFGQRVVDYFSAQSHNPYEQSETLEDVQIGVNIVRTLLKMGHHEEAFKAYMGDLSNALLFNLEAYKLALALIKPFFPKAWNVLPSTLETKNAASLANEAGVVLNYVEELNDSLVVYNTCIFSALTEKEIPLRINRIRNVSTCLYDLDRLADSIRVCKLAMLLAELTEDQESTFLSRLQMFTYFTYLGDWEVAEEMWMQLDPMGRDWSRNCYRPGSAERAYAWFKFYKGEALLENDIANAERLTIAGKNRNCIRSLCKLRGISQFHLGNLPAAAENFDKSVRMAREIERSDAYAETMLALTKLHLNQLNEPVHEAERLEQLKEPAFNSLAELWFALGNNEKARLYALKAYKRAWAEGEPYVHGYDLNRAIALLMQLGVAIPQLPPYDPSKEKKLPWEDKVVELIEQLKKEKEKNG